MKSAENFHPLDGVHAEIGFQIQVEAENVWRIARTLRDECQEFLGNERLRHYGCHLRCRLYSLHHRNGHGDRRRSRRRHMNRRYRRRSYRGIRDRGRSHRPAGDDRGRCGLLLHGILIRDGCWDIQIAAFQQCTHHHPMRIEKAAHQAVVTLQGLFEYRSRKRNGRVQVAATSSVRLSIWLSEKWCFLRG